MNVWAWFLDQIEPYQWGLAGFIGAVVAAWHRRDELRSRSDRAVFALSGAAIAHFLTGIISSYFDVPSANAGGIGFLLGLFGGTLVQVGFRSLKSADFWQFIMSRWGK